MPAMEASAGGHGGGATRWGSIIAAIRSQIRLPSTSARRDLQAISYLNSPFPAASASPCAMPSQCLPTRRERI